MHDAAGSARSPKDGGRLTRRLRLLIAGVPLLSLGALLALASFRPVPALDSGDALLDAFYAGFDARGRLPWESAMLRPGRDRDHFDMGSVALNLFPHSASSSRLLGAVDERFADDPRHWELLVRNYNPGFNPALAEQLKADGFEPQEWFAGEARRRGVANVALMAAWLQRYDDEWYRAGERAGVDSPVPASTVKGAVGWPCESWAAEQRAFAQASAAEIDPLLAELRAIDPEDAAGYYVAARLLAASGRMGEAHAAIARGNRCTRVSNFTMLGGEGFWQYSGPPPPRLFMVEELAFGQTVARPLPNFTQWKDAVRQLAVDAAERDDRAALTELNRFCIRLSTNGDAPLISQLVGAVLCADIRNALTTYSDPPLSAEELTRLGQYSAQAGSVRGELARAQAAVAPAYGVLSGIMGGQPAGSGEFMLWEARGLLSAGDQTKMSILQIFSDMDRIEQQFYETRVNPLWDQLAEFDFETLTFPASPAATAEGNRTPD